MLTAEDHCIPLDVLAFMAAAIEFQVRRDLAPIYGGPPWSVSAMSSLDGVRGDANVRKILTFKTKIADANALAFHTDFMGVEYAESLPPAFDAVSIDATAPSHEVIETFCDPECTATRPRASGDLVDYETADPVEGDSYVISVTIGTELRAVSVSNFVYPAWFGEAAGPYDFMGKLDGPWKMTPGGYFRLTDRKGNELYVYADNAARARVTTKLANPTSRVARRDKT